MIRSLINIDENLEKQNRSATAEIYQDYTHWDYDEMERVDEWELCEEYLLTYLVLKFLFTFLTLSCPVPSGIFGPTFTMGAVLGQLYCSWLLRTLGALGFPDLIKYRGIYSILGAASLTASVTRTVSVAVIVLEMNGHLSHVVPVLVCVLVSYIISELIHPVGIYEMLFELRGYKLLVQQKGRIQVKEVL